jgi:hypothetical protein
MTVAQPAPWFDNVVVLGFAISGFVGGLAVHVLFNAPPVIVSLFLGTGVAALVYRFLGGIPPGTTATIGVFKFGGSLAALLASA